eukprot:TRINITY_DN27888_c0_g1_i2.p3 TRINITY_DN27888_c0_g1~~TRINITY_DN27888_c0_g1_i2.p3  ORF type:complete len:138 (-),score=14.43 TRINITY_DN27888_c0_g1_i2:273-686(-)
MSDKVGTQNSIGYILSLPQALLFGLATVASSATVSATLAYRYSANKFEREGLGSRKELLKNIPLALKALGISSSLVGSLGVFMCGVLPYMLGVEVKREIDLGPVNYAKAMMSIGEKLYLNIQQEFVNKLKGGQPVNR